MLKVCYPLRFVWVACFCSLTTSLLLIFLLRLRTYYASHHVFRNSSSLASARTTLPRGFPPRWTSSSSPQIFRPNMERRHGQFASCGHDAAHCISASPDAPYFLSHIVTTKHLLIHCYYDIPLLSTARYRVLSFIQVNYLFLPYSQTKSIIPGCVTLL